MNGRIYDPGLGRFLQPDPVIQAPNNAQSWNAYTYVFNNPLRYTDPTGMIGIEERQWAGAAVAIVMTAIYPGSAPMWYSMLTGMVAGWVSTGNMQGAITGAISAGLFAGIGSYFDSARWANAPSGSGAFGSGLTWGGYGAKTLSHGVAGGVMSSMQGGKFGHGFASAGAAQAFSPMINNIGNNAPARIAASAMVAGTASVLSGGKFANGAVTGAVMAAIAGGQRSQHQYEDSREGDSVWTTAKELLDGAQRWLTLPEGLNQEPVLAQMRDAWSDSLASSPSRRHEEGGYYGYEKDGSWGVRRWDPGHLDGIRAPKFDANGMYRGLRIVGSFHTHPSPRIDEFGQRWVLGPSSADIAKVRDLPGPSFIIDHDTIYSYDGLGSRAEGARTDVLNYR